MIEEAKSAHNAVAPKGFATPDQEHVPGSAEHTRTWISLWITSSVIFGRLWVQSQ